MATAGLNIGGGNLSLPSVGNYDAMRKAAEQQYASVIGGYQSMLGQQQQRAMEIQGGYTQLGNEVMDYLKGVEDPMRTLLDEKYTKARGDATLYGLNKGLSGTTVVPGLQRGLARDEAVENRALTGDMGKLYAGTATQLGGMRLGAAEQAQQQLQSLANAQLGFMGSYPLQAMQGLGNLELQHKQFQADQPYQVASTTSISPGFNWNFGGTPTPAGNYTTYQMYDPRTGRTSPSR